jgi:DNA-3-methyladenine glycosylase I
MHSPDFKQLFDAIESTLVDVGTESGVPNMRTQLDWYKGLTEQRLEDADYYDLIVEITFYSGFKAVTVDAKLQTIRAWFPNYITVARYGSEQVGKMSADPLMIKHEKKLWACIKNARTFRDIVTTHGSFRAFVDSFAPKASFKNLMMLRYVLITKFAFLGGTTSLHFLMEIGLPVLKPDIVVTRIFHRLGFIEDESVSEARRFQCVEIGQKFVEATGYPIRYIDIVFVAYGQMSGAASIQQGICLKTNPRCHVCAVRDFCSYPRGAPKPLGRSAVGQSGSIREPRPGQSTALHRLLGRDETPQARTENTQPQVRNAKVTLSTWAGRKTFQYDGSVKEGTLVYCGREFRNRYDVPADQYAAMLATFSGQELCIGTSRTPPPDGSLGKWLTDRYGQYGMTSYIGPILIREGYAVRGSRPDRIRFN